MIFPFNNNNFLFWTFLFTINVFLFQIEPTPNKSDVSNPGYSSLERALNWSTPAQEWFDQEVFGKRYLAQFTPNSNCHIPRYSCRLYNVDQALVSAF